MSDKKSRLWDGALLALLVFIVFLNIKGTYILFTHFHDKAHAVSD